LNAISKIGEQFIRLRERLWPFRFHILVAGGAVLLGVSVGMFKLSREPAKALVADRWDFPHWSPYQAGTVRTEMTATPIFVQDPAKKKAEQDAQAAVPAWRFTGTVQEGHKQIALIEVDKGRHIRRLLPGDELPGGAKITSVVSGQLTYTDGSGEQVLKLFAADNIRKKQ
jgi:hypothetical protein